MKLLILFCFVCLGATALAQQSDSIQKRKRKPKMHLEFGGNYSPISSLSGGELHGMLGISLSKKWIVGLGAGGFFAVQKDKDTPDNNFIIEGHYAGFTAEYELLQFRRTSLSIPILVGVGKVSYIRQSDNKNLENNYFIAEDVSYGIASGLDVDIRLSSFLKIGLRAQYRLMGDIDLVDKNNRLLPADAGRAWAAGIVFKLGDFENRCNKACTK